MPSNKKNSKKKSPKPNVKNAKRVKKAASSRLVPKPSRTKRAAKKKQPKKKAAKPRLARSRGSQLRDTQFESVGSQTSSISGRQSGDLEGLSRAEQADSESVDELVEEGNVAEAGAVAGVEEADSADEREVHTHEVPEDDVPEEYLDNE
jgi:hypothetical protein